MVLIGSSAISPLRSRAKTLVVLAAVLFALFRRLRKAVRPKARRPNRNQLEPLMDLRRQMALAKGEAIDHTGRCVLVHDETFNLDGTIFHSIQGVLERTILKRQLAGVPHWNDDGIVEVQQEAARLPPVPPVPKAVTDFMLSECNFKMEHADGSFMDHVSFCHDYAAIHFKAHSPRVLLLHSIFGVGTNVFPMEVSKAHKVAELLNPEEFHHVQCFPSILRLLVTGELLASLNARRGSLDKLKGISFHRVIDNKALEMDVKTLWVHLNYQLIHWIDFLPAADWDIRYVDPLFQAFLELRDFLVRANQLQAKVDLGSATSQIPEAAELLRAGSAPWPVLKRKFAAKAIRKYSAACGHSLEYSLQWNS